MMQRNLTFPKYVYGINGISHFKTYIRMKPVRTLLFALLLSSLALFSSCKKELVQADDLINVTPGPNGDPSATFNPATQTLVSQGTFKNGDHPTSGMAKLYKKGTTYTLVFDTFKTDEGPDLRIYLAEDTKATNFVELTELKNTGNFYLTLPDNAMVDKRTVVLIWCKRFSVNFGSAELKTVTNM